MQIAAAAAVNNIRKRQLTLVGPDTPITPHGSGAGSLVRWVPAVRNGRPSRWAVQRCIESWWLHGALRKFVLVMCMEASHSAYGAAWMGATFPWESLG